MEGFAVTAPGFHVVFEEGQVVTISYQYAIRNPEGDTSRTGVARDAKTGSLIVGASATTRSEVFESEWFSGLTFDSGEQVCRDGRELAFKTLENERCTVRPGKPETCTLWGESYNVRGGTYDGQGTSFIITRTDAMIPGSLEGE
jgi:hypothetical protein